MRSKATARDVAREAGVSLATVDRVLNNRGGVAPEKERRVVLAARRLKLDRALEFRAARTLRIGVFVQPPSNPFHAALAEAAERQNRGPNPFNFELSVLHVDPAAPSRTARTIQETAARFDALIICAAEDPEIVVALRSFAATDKPVVALATDFGPDVPHIYVGPDDYRAGRVAGHLMGRFLGREGGKVLLIAGMMSMIGQRQRREGFRAAITEDFPEVEIVEEVESGENGERAGLLVAWTLARHPDLCGVYNASAGAAEIAEALARVPDRDRCVFITHELTEDRRRLLRAGAIDAIIDQNPDLELRISVEALAERFGRLETGPMTTITPVRIHTRENC
ncbi:LacI family DNA-binding transcriptional regulator [Palleronia rufa]|uniref:LacI family DNA-binding transcriptional regulator n=1 Tax=Palleronia rufa TaxID=1530186 RepID=UPI00056A9BD9|nr:LacI family DNA-binding transcriptional regulator [Palleronia rufa]